MSRAGHAYETIMWTGQRCVPLVEAIVSRMGGAIKPIGIGGPRQAEVRELAKRLTCAYDDDLRRLVIEKAATYLLLTTMEQTSPAALTTAIQQGMTILTLEPIAAAFEELMPANTATRQEQSADSSRSPAAPGRILHSPAFSRSIGWLSAADPQLVIGSLRSASMIASSCADDASLFSRLHETWRILLDLSALPESIDCVIQSTSRDQPVALRDLTGSLTAQARLADGSSLLIQLNEAAASPALTRCDRSLHLIGERGRLRASDLTYELFDHTGHLLDQREADRAAPPFTFADAVAQHWMQIIDRPALADPPRRDPAAHEAAALACCLTCLLSARTGQPESPGKLMAAHGWK